MLGYVHDGQHTLILQVSFQISKSENVVIIKGFDCFGTDKFCQEISKNITDRNCFFTTVLIETRMVERATENELSTENCPRKEGRLREKRATHHNVPHLFSFHFHCFRLFLFFVFFSVFPLFLSAAKVGCGRSCSDLCG